jgi:hypothetical protein
VPGTGLVLVAKHLNPVDLFFEFVFIDEAVDLDGAEKIEGDCRLGLCAIMA